MYGSHWIGVFAASAPPGHALRSGELHVFSPNELGAMAGVARELLKAINGVRVYRFLDPPPLGQAQLAQLNTDICRLAVRGRRLFHNLFVAHDATSDNNRLASLHAALRERI